MEQLVIALDLILTDGKQKIEILHKELGKLSSNWGIIKCGASERSILGLLLFLLHFNDLPLGINTASKPLLYADDTSALLANNSLHDLQIKSANALYSVSEWFTVTGLSLI